MAASLDDLITQGLGAQILTPEQQRARIQQVLAGTLPGAMRQYGQTAQQQNEASFGRGMGLSTYNAYQQALNSLMENEGLAKIQNDTQTQVQQAQNAALANAAGYAGANANRAAQQSIAAGNQTVARQLQKARGNQALQSQLVQGAAGIGAGGGGMLAKSLLSKPGSGGTPSELWQNAKANLNDLTGGGATPAYPEIGTAAGTSEMAANPAAYNAPSAPDQSASFPGFDMSQWGGGGSDAGDMLGAYSYGGPGLDLNNLLTSTFSPNNAWVDF